jgi:phage nucleotide-binding protein
MMPEVHSALGYSAVSSFEQCPFQYKCRYIDQLEALPSDDPANPLIIGTALHKGIETDVDTAIQEYFSSYPVIDDKHIDEEIKLRYLIPKVKETLPEGTHEVQVTDTNFIGTLDLLVPVPDEEFKWGDIPYGTKDAYDLYDFKYTNNWMRYMDSRQLHLYKYYFEKMNPGKRIRNMYFVFIPKVQIRQKQTEDLHQFRQRLLKELDKVSIKVEPVNYDPQKVIDHLELTQQILQCQNYEKNPTRLCDWCELKKYCQEGDLQDMALPSIQEVAITIEDHKKIWLYGEPFSGKTHLASVAPKPILELNTDGNIKHYTMPRISITDTKDGRQTIPAWEVFKNAVDDLANGSEFKTIVLDLTEDIYDHCRKYMCDKRGWEHESDDSFKAYDIVRSEFLREIRKLVNLPYNIILISHQDVSKDITKRSGDKVTKIRPNIADKIANKLAGMVDIVVRCIKDNDSYVLSTKTSDVIFGGGRLTGLKAVDVPNCWESIDAMYATVGGQKAAEQPETTEVVHVPTEQENAAAEVTEAEELVEKLKAAVDTEEPKRRTRRTRS